VGTGLTRAANFAWIAGFVVVQVVAPYLYPTLLPLELDSSGNLVRAIELPPNFGVHVILATATAVFLLAVVQGIWEWRRSSLGPASVSQLSPSADP
jgi:hypothetical protein